MHRFAIQILFIHRNKSNFTYLSLILLLFFFLNLAFAEKKNHQKSITLNPIGTAVSVVATGLSFTSLSLSGRYQRSVNDRWALVIAPQVTYTDLTSLETYLLGAKFGARYCLSNRYLDGWYTTPMFLLGWAFTRQFDEFFQSAYMSGVGVESGYTWRWNTFVLEFGLGLHYSGLVAYESSIRGGNSKIPPFSVAPILNVGIGYSW